VKKNEEVGSVFLTYLFFQFEKGKKHGQGGAKTGTVTRLTDALGSTYGTAGGDRASARRSPAGAG
jgi:hypothetical protein